MKDRSSLPINFLRRAEIRKLVPDLKLVLVALNITCDSNVGCWIPEDLTGDTGLDVTALNAAYDVLENRGFIVRDTITGEFFLKDFFRHNTFKGVNRRSQAEYDFLNIESVELCNLIIEASKWSNSCLLPMGFFEEVFLKHRHGKQGKQSQIKKSNKGLIKFRRDRKKLGF